MILWNNLNEIYQDINCLSSFLKKLLKNVYINNYNV